MLINRTENIFIIYSDPIFALLISIFARFFSTPNIARIIIELVGIGTNELIATATPICLENPSFLDRINPDMHNVNVPIMKHTITGTINPNTAPIGILAKLCAIKHIRPSINNPNESDFLSGARSINPNCPITIPKF